MGVAFALDDFGTGYSSLALLRSMPLSYLKFDRSFTADLGRDPVTEHLLETCRDLASRMGIALIAEGVETDEQRVRLIDMGVQLAQGYLFSVPLPIGELQPLITAIH
jgi:EAL domain-containing protein (putative c-di-GMP-specific phosphodiesterase class I)